MYLENDDLCKRIIDNKGKIFVVPKAKINHIGGGAVDSKYKKQIELSRNWHWMWSKFYYKKKHHGYLSGLISTLPNFISSLIKYLFYSFTMNRIKKNIYKMRFLGLLNSYLLEKSFYRPNLK